MWLQDFHAYDPVKKTWEDLSYPLAGTPPINRSNHGFAALDGKLYVFGGSGLLPADTTLSNGQEPRRARMNNSGMHSYM